MDQIKIFSPASVANVSCGFDVLGFCLDTIGDIMKVSKTENPGVTIGSVTGQELPKDPLKNVASVAASSLLKAHSSNNGFRIDIEKRIKPGSGIGSSAASAAGAVLLLMNYWGGPIQEMD